MRTGIIARAAEIARSGEAGFALRAWLVAPFVEGALALAGLDQTLRWIERVPVRRARRPVGIPRGESAVRRAFGGHPWFRGQCLPRALTQYLIHRRDGTPARFVIGVRRPDDRFQAHAWVEAPGAGTLPGDFAPILTADGGRLP